MGHSQYFSFAKHVGPSSCQRAQFWFHLPTELSPTPSLNHLNVHCKLKMGIYRWLLEQEDLVGAAVVFLAPFSISTYWDRLAMDHHDSSRVDI